jgi:hypothetical protein
MTATHRRQAPPVRPAVPATAAQPGTGVRIALRLLCASASTAAVGVAALEALTAGPGPRAMLALPPDRLALRVLLLAVAACSAVLTTGGVLGAIGVTCRSARAWAHAERLTAGLAGRIASIAVVASIGATGQVASASVMPDDTPVLRLLDDTGADESTDHDAPVLRLLESEDGPLLERTTDPSPAIEPPGAPSTHRPAATEPVDAEPAAPNPDTTGPGAAPGIDPATTGGTGPSRHRVEHGDNLWSIAEAVVTAYDGGEPDQRTIAAYWLRLIERNRANLADPDDPDLLFCGQWLDLPDR